MNSMIQKISNHLDSLEEIPTPVEIEQKRLFFETHCCGFIDFLITNDSSRVISSNLDHVIRIWDVQTRLLEFVLLGHTDYIETMSTADDNVYLISGSRDKTIRVWNLQKRQLIKLITHDCSIRKVAISKSKTYIVALTSEKKNLFCIWNI